MKAAVVETYAESPRYREFAEPAPAATEGLVRLAVRAAALSQLVRAQAAGKHYSSPTPPFVPGVDGVGVRLDGPDAGQRVYFAFPKPPLGAMAEHVAVPAAQVTPVPDGVDDVTAAAIANPGMSSWVALTERAGFVAGETVWINGATGASGRLAIGVARHLGAGRVVVTGRSDHHAQALRDLGADAYVSLATPAPELSRRLREELHDHPPDVVLDYLWGAPALAVLEAIAGAPHAGAAARRVRFVNIGSLAGAATPLPAAVLRSSGLELLGSGLGSASLPAIVRAVGGVLAATGAGGLGIAATAVPLAEVEATWTAPDPGRLVFTL